MDVAASIAATGKPLGYSHGVLKPILSHPTLYHTLLAVPVSIWGEAPAAGRSLGVVCFAGAALFVFLTVRRLTTTRWPPVLALALFVLHPLAVNSALLVEIDTTLLVLFATVFFYWLVRLDFQLSLKTSSVLGAFFGVCLLAKLTTPPLFLVALAVYYAVNRDWTNLKWVPLVVFVSAAVFAVVYFPYTLALGLPWYKPFVHPFSRAADVAGASYLVTLAKRAVRIMLWVGLPLILAWGAAVWARRRDWFGGRLAPVDYAAVLGVMIFIGYWLVGGDGYGFVKYHAPLVPLLAIFLAVHFGPAVARERARSLVFILGLAFAFYLLAARDSLYYPYAARELTEVRGVSPGAVRTALLLTGGTYLFPILSFGLIARAGRRAMVVFLVGLAAGPALIVNQLYKPYSHRYNYGEAGLEDAIGTVDSYPEDAAVVVPLDVAFGDDYRHPHKTAESVLGDRDELLAAISAADTALVIFRDSYYLHGPWRGNIKDPGVRTVLRTDFERVRSGSFEYYVRETGGAVVE
ncbi:MAG: glycosyltransferase family 39 protein [Candidatus Coatesbacteria bacterium]|nr:MAG: glycosyltransferase family 39 protein [Candidatus Coatesbacteria bacterium]